MSKTFPVKIRGNNYFRFYKMTVLEQKWFLLHVPNISLNYFFVASVNRKVKISCCFFCFFFSSGGEGDRGLGFVEQN